MNKDQIVISEFFKHVKFSRAIVHSENLGIAPRVIAFLPLLSLRSVGVNLVKAKGFPLDVTQAFNVLLGHLPLGFFIYGFCFWHELSSL